MRALTRTWPGLVALLAFASSAVALVFALWPGLKPDPGTNYSAEVAIFSVERGVTLSEYLDRLAFSPALYAQRRRQVLDSMGPGADAPGNLKTHGEVVYVSSTVEGFKRRSVTLRWSLYDARTLRRRPDPQFSDVPAVRLDLDAPTDRTMQLVWMPPLPGRGPWLVRVGLYDERDTLLDVADSRPFLGPRPPPLTVR